MNRRTKESQDNRDDRWKKARTDGEYTDMYTGGLCPMRLEHGFLVPDQNYIDAENARRERIRNGR